MALNLPKQSNDDYGAVLFAFLQDLNWPVDKIVETSVKVA